MENSFYTSVINIFYKKSQDLFDETIRQFQKELSVKSQVETFVKPGTIVTLINQLDEKIKPLNELGEAIAKQYDQEYIPISTTDIRDRLWELYNKRINFEKNYFI
ncbi:MAG: hypothetical protein ACOYT4_03010 [Nanoarchaeota archaeon]